MIKSLKMFLTTFLSNVRRGSRRDNGGIGVFLLHALKAPRIQGLKTQICCETFQSSLVSVINFRTLFLGNLM